MRTSEQILKELIGDLTFQLAILKAENEKLKAALADRG